MVLELTQKSFWKARLGVALLSISLFSANTFAAPAVSHRLRSYDHIDFTLRGIEVRQEKRVLVKIPVELFSIWQQLQMTLPFEVGGGLDFNFLRELERIKLSYGTQKTVSYTPDFEIGWHTHPKGNKKGYLANFSPPSPSDIKISIINNFNHWLILQNKVKSDYSNLIRLTSYSMDVSRPAAVELNMVVDADGVYQYKANTIQWQKLWEMGPAELIKRINTMENQLQNIINYSFPKVRKGEWTVSQARRYLLQEYRNIANINLTFTSWKQLLTEGLTIQLDVVELLQHERKRAQQTKQ